MDRVTVTYRIRSLTTLITNPLGGGVYILVPYLADAGIVTITIATVIGRRSARSGSDHFTPRHARRTGRRPSG